MDKRSGDFRDATALLLHVGTRVRAARKAAGIPRRVLSERSGISPRYLAQLEAGEGNISIALLFRVACALERPVTWFLSDVSEETVALLSRFEAATPDMRARILSELETGRMADTRAGRICLIGLRGAGKSTLGRRASKMLGVPFVELSTEIEALGQMPVAEIMALYGAEGFRKFEAEALERALAQHSRMVLAVAGGIVTDTDVFEHLLSTCHTIWLKASPKEHMARVRDQGDLRPMEGQPRAMTQLQALLDSRSAQYARADAVLDTSGRSLDESTQDLLALLSSHGLADLGK